MSQHNGRHQIRRPLLLELAGPAGVGKSTLSTAMVRRFQAVPSTIWGLPTLSLLGNGVCLLPTLIGLWLHARSPLWNEASHLVRLRTLHRALRHAKAGSDEVMIFDEGPVFALAWLRGFGHETLRNQASADWWHTALREWAGVIDAVVVLEAPDTLLARRIRARPGEHEVKEFPDPEISLWMARFREALDWVLAGMARHGGPAVLRVSTAGEPAEWIAGRLVESLERGTYDH